MSSLSDINPRLFQVAELTGRRLVAENRVTQTNAFQRGDVRVAVISGSSSPFDADTDQSVRRFFFWDFTACGKRYGVY